MSCRVTHILVDDISMIGMFLTLVTLQAAQVRKSRYAGGGGVGQGLYDPETHPACTIYAGTTVQQVCFCKHSTPSACHYILGRAQQLWTHIGNACCLVMLLWADTCTARSITWNKACSPYLTQSMLLDHT